MTVDVKTEREISYNCEQASLFEMVAEECSELSHVSSKIARYLRKDQPVSEDFNIMSALTNFLEEFADVYLSARVAQRSTDVFFYQIYIISSLNDHNFVFVVKPLRQICILLYERSVITMLIVTSSDPKVRKVGYLCMGVVLAACIVTAIAKKVGA